MDNHVNIIFNLLLLIFFFVIAVSLLYISYKDNKKYTKNYTLRKLLFIQKNT